MPDCLLCRWSDADREFGRTEVWRDELWRLTVSLAAPVVGFSYLEPLRHIPHITDLDGAEAATLGPTLARVTSVLKAESGADLVYVTVFGERVAHLHLNIAPHREGDALLGGPGLLRPGAEPPPESQLRDVAGRVRRRLN
jgi:diadenosine tetraphosphate (Ap4A) HIT family hydrolase